MLIFIKEYGLYKDGELYSTLGRSDYYADMYMNFAMIALDAAEIDYAILDLSDLEGEDKEVREVLEKIKKALENDKEEELRKVLIDYARLLKEE